MKGILICLVLTILSFVNISLSYAQIANQILISRFKSEGSVKAAIDELSSLKRDSNRVILLNELGKYFLNYSHSDTTGFEKAVQFFEEGKALSASFYTPQAQNRFTSQILLGRAFLLSGRIKKGVGLFQEAIDHYHTLQNKSAEANTLFFFALSYLNSQDSVLAAYSRSIELYHEIGAVRPEIEARIAKEQFIFRVTTIDLSDKELKMIADQSLANECYRLVNIYLRIATVNRYLGNLNSALNYSFAALQTVGETRDSTDLHNVLGEIALTYSELGKGEESIEYFKKCIAIREKIQSEQYVIYRTAELMITEMIKVHQGEEGYRFLQLLRERNPPHGELENAIMEHGIANCLSSFGRYDLAEKHFRAMIKSYEKFDRSEATYLAQIDLIKFFIHTGKYQEADGYYETLDNIRKGVNSTIAQCRDISRCLFKIDSARQRFRQAIANLQLYNTYNDSLFNREKSEQIESLHVRYNSEKKDENIALLTKQLELQQANLRQSVIIRNSILAGSVLLGMFLLLLYNRYRLKIKSNELLEKKQDEISKQNYSLQLVISEKEWLIREIHHRVKNNFHMVIGLMGKQSSYIKNPEALQALEDSQNRIQTMSLIHQKLYQSENLSTIFMPDYIHELVSFLKSSFDTEHILFVVHSDSIELDISYSLPIGLILNEAITNSIKYAFPYKRDGKIEITLRYTVGNHMQLIITDNGVGIAERKDANHNSMGLSLIAGLSEDISGTLSIRNDNGTTIQINFDYEVENKDALS